MTTILAYREISKRFGAQQAVDGVSLEVHEGEILSLLGPSGCGKTTLLRLAGGFLLPDAGTVHLHGEDITLLAPDMRRLNTIFQSYALFPHLSVRGNLEFGPRMARWSKEQTKREVERMLALVQLEPEADKKPGALSGGQKQRVALARALILRPSVLLLDEPFAALDLKLRQRMLLELERLQREVGITFVFVTHDQSEAMSISTRIAVMQAGRIAQLGSPREIYEHPVNRFVTTFIGDTNLFEGQVESLDGRPCLNVPGLPKLGLPTGAEAGNGAVLSVRPEKIRLGEHAGLTALDNRLHGKVQDVVYLGSQTRYMVEVERRLVQVLCPHDRLDGQPALRVGDPVHLGWSAADGYLLPDGGGPAWSEM